MYSGMQELSCRNTLERITAMYDRLNSQRDINPDGFGVTKDYDCVISVTVARLPSKQ